MAAPTRFAHLDALRAVAVGLVVLAHAGLGDIVPGGSGVTIFFTISGFIITHLVLREWDRTGGFDVGGFYWRRLVKLAPPLVVVVVVPTLIYALFEDVSWGQFASQVLFSFNWLQITPGSDLAVLPGTEVVWSLSIEEQFYIVFALVALLAVRSGHLRTMLVTVGVVGVVVPTVLRVWLVAGGAPPERTYYGTDTRADAIAIGVLLAIWMARVDAGGAVDMGAVRADRVRRSLGSPAALVFAGAAYLVSLLYRDPEFRETFRYSIQAVATAALIAYGFWARPGTVSRLFHTVAGWRIVQVVGLASYSIYLVHFCLYHALWALGVPEERWTVPLLAAAGLGSGIALWHWVEQPVLAWRRERERTVPLG